MPEGVEIRVRGTAQLAAGTRDLVRNIERAAATDAVRASADQTANVVRSRVPVKSGRLRASVRSTVRGRTGRVEMGAGLPYAGWIEFGGSRGRAGVSQGRYTYPAAKQQERAFVRSCENAATGEIQRMRWPTPR